MDLETLTHSHILNKEIEELGGVEAEQNVHAPTAMAPSMKSKYTAKQKRLRSHPSYSAS